MVDVTPNANSGTFVDLSKLNTIDIGTEKEFKEIATNIMNVDVKINQVDR